MLLSADRLFKLAGPCGDGRLPYVNEHGAFLGAAVPLLERDQSGDWRPRPQSELERLLTLGYGVPVDLGGRMSRLAAVARALNKDDLSLAGIALIRMELPPLPNDELARAMAKADGLSKFDPGEPRVPAGNPGGGEWSDGGDSGSVDREGSAADGLVQLASAHVDETEARKDRFVDAHLADAQKLADQLHVPVENILGIAALESGWGENRFSVQGNNLFGIYYPAPYANGYLIAEKSGNKLAAYASYADCLKSFAEKYGPLIQGIQDPAKFASILQDKAKFGINPKDGTKVPSYVGGVVATIRGIRRIIVSRKA